MEAEERVEKLESFRQAPTLLRNALDQFPLQMWQFKPSPESWSIHEMAVHIADSEAMAYLRFCRCIAEPGQAVVAYDGDRWARELRYHEQSPEEAIELFSWLRSHTWKLIHNLPEPAWSQTIEHPERGTLTLDDLLDTYERHIPEHIEQMWDNYRAWVDHQW